MCSLPNLPPRALNMRPMHQVLVASGLFARSLSSSHISGTWFWLPTLLSRRLHMSSIPFAPMQMQMIVSHCAPRKQIVCLLLAYLALTAALQAICMHRSQAFQV